MTASHAGRVRAEHPSLERYLATVLSHGQLQRPLLISFTQWEFAVAAIAETVATLRHMGSEVSIGLWSDETPLKDVGRLVHRPVARALLSATIDQRLECALESAGLPASAFVRPVPGWRPQGVLPPIIDTRRSAIRQLAYRGAPMGRGILQVPPHVNVPVTDDYEWPRKYVEAAARSYAFVFDQAFRAIEQLESTSVLSYNGRFLHDSAVVAAAEAFDLPVLAYDSGGMDTDFDLTIDATHDWAALQTRMLAMYDSWPSAEREQLGSSWFQARVEHTEAANAAFTDGQVRGRGVDRRDDEVLVTYFSSSGDEIAELGLDWTEFFGGQEEALRQLAETCRELGYRLLVRTHPHKRVKPRRDVQDWHAAVEQASPDIHLEETSDIDSYTLMRQSDVVVTYGSTTGVEAAFAGIPVVVMGPSAYDRLGCAVRVANQTELRAALIERRIPPSGSALPFGLLMMRRGFTYEHVQRVGAARTLAGVPLVEPRPLARHVSNLLDRAALRRLVGAQG